MAAGRATAASGCHGSVSRLLAANVKSCCATRCQDSGEPLSTPSCGGA